jgi:hypothetical protein
MVPSTSSFAKRRGSIFPEHAGLSTRFRGGPPEASARLILYVQRHPWPHGNVSIIWRDERVRGIDIVGKRHKHPLTGISVATPHQQWKDAEGREMIEPVDLDEAEIDCMQSAFRWMLEWCQIQSDAVWRDPPFDIAAPLSRGRAAQDRPS